MVMSWSKTFFTPMFDIEQKTENYIIYRTKKHRLHNLSHLQKTETLQFCNVSVLYLDFSNKRCVLFLMFLYQTRVLCLTLLRFTYRDADFF